MTRHDRFQDRLEARIERVELRIRLRFKWHLYQVLVIRERRWKQVVTWAGLRWEDRWRS